MKRIILLLSLVLLLVPSCTDSPVKILVKEISFGGTGDNYVVTPAKVEVTSIKINSVVAVPITITNNDNQPKTFQFKVVSPISGETSAGYTSYPVQGIDTFFSQDTITIEGGKKGIVNFFIARVDKIPDTQVWVNVSVETSQQITSAYIVNILIKGDK
jgi:hypothetical protein